eukprot:gb/GECH01006934.1/.p1 GENE.gb/GECH01006934.1/~~gb/GECH01006934.1/.p1  ORF type:complete len:1110 (+),score=348.77 gb/GECH01006934.1/:1-3330(+)
MSEEQKKEEELVSKENEKQKREIIQQAEQIRTLRKKNVNAKENRPNDSYFRKLETNVKKNNAFTKRLRNFSASDKKEILQGLEKRNLKKYVSEAAKALAEGVQKANDVPAAVEVCSRFHQLYPNFAEEVVSNLQKSCTENTEDTSRYRVSLRMLGELYIVGIFTEPSPVVKSLKSLIVRDSHVTNIKILSAVQMFVKHVGQQFLLESPKDAPFSDLKAFTTSEERIVPPQISQDIKNTLDIYFGHVCNALLREHSEMVEKEKEVQHLMATKGELTDDEKTAYQSTKKSFNSYYNIATTLAQHLNKEMVELPESSTTRSSNKGDENEQNEEQEDITPFEDEETRAFYEDIPKLSELVPSPLASVSSSQENTENVEKEANHEKDSSEKSLEDKDSGEKNKEEKESSPEDSNTQKMESKEEEEESNSSLDELFRRLKHTFSSRLISEWCVEFNNHATRENRRKLVEEMYKVNRTALDLLPYFSRIVCILGSTYKDIPQMLINKLENQFEELFRQKNQINIETKVKNIRFLGELTKFQLIPPNSMLNFLSRCTEDFSHHNIDIACHLLEVTGRYLYANPQTKARTENLLGKMLRAKKVKTLAEHHEDMVENAYYSTKPPKRSARPHIQELPPLHQFINHLLFSELNKNNVSRILRKIRKMPWNDNNTVAAIFEALIKISRSKYDHINLVAQILSNLARYHDQLCIQVVDQLIENIREGMIQDDIPAQRRIMEAKFLGELYNYMMVNSTTIFNVLYAFLYFNPEGDPPLETFRIRLACTLLDTCGPYFNKKSTQRKLTRFLAHFQMYILGKGVRLPVDVEYQLADTLEELHTNLRWPSTYEEGKQLVELLDQKHQRLGQSIVLPSANAFVPIVLSSKSSELGNGTNSNTSTEISSDSEDDDLDNNRILDQIRHAKSPASFQNTITEKQQEMEADELDRELAGLVESSLSERKPKSHASSASSSTSQPGMFRSSPKFFNPNRSLSSDTKTNKSQQSQKQQEQSSQESRVPVTFLLSKKVKKTVTVPESQLGKRNPSPKIRTELPHFEGKRLVQKQDDIAKEDISKRTLELERQQQYRDSMEPREDNRSSFPSLPSSSSPKRGRRPGSSKGRTRRR